MIASGTERAQRTISVDRMLRQGSLKARRRGQSLIVAVIVMFVLLLIGSIFVGIVARNLLNSGRAKDTVSAGQFAEAGIKYADLNLQNSPEGADWRPAPVLAASINANDPDANWLRRGFSRIELNGGRALVKVTYRPGTMTDPQNPLNKVLNPLGKYIKIESVGRVGNLNPNDPTSFLNTPSPRLRREYVAYKAIGLIDYLRFVTNKNNDTKVEAFIGIQPFGVPVFMQMGGLPLNLGVVDPGSIFSNNRMPGASIMVNGKLHLGNNTILAVDRRNGEAIRASDDIIVDPEVNGDPTRFGARLNDLEQYAANTDPTAAGATTPPLIIPSDGNFNSYKGLIRDSAGVPDIFGYVRAISRQEPPSLDAPDQATGLTRYKQLTRNSGKFLPNPNNANQPFDLGRIGLGSGLYIDNPDDIEPDPQNVSNEPTAKYIWLHPGASSTRAVSNWHGPYYVPPATKLEFGYPVVQDRDPATSDLTAGSYSPHPGFHIEHFTGTFRDLEGQRLSRKTMDFTYFIYKPAGLAPVLKIESDFYREPLRAAPYNMSEKAIDKFLPDFNGVIYGEGNLQVRGLLPGTKNIQIRRENPGEPNALSDTQVRDLISTSVSVVSGANIHISGSLIREDPRSMAALLAVDYVVVNTTLFVASSGGDLQFSTSNDDAVPPGHGPIGTGTSPFSVDFLFGENPGGYVDQANAKVPINLLLRHGVDGQAATYLNLWLNEWAPHTVGAPGTGPQPLYWFNIADPNDPTLPSWTYPLTSTSTAMNIENRAIQILPKSGDPTNLYLFTGDAGYAWPQGLRNVIRPSVDVNHVGSFGPSDYQFGRAAISPMDMRIEAVVYAQNKSFFIIPGYPVNNNGGYDSRQAAMGRALGNNPAAPLGSMYRFGSTDPLFPLADEPYDCRITLVGAISENRTAAPGEQAEWMKLWGWIPQVYGSTGKDVNSAVTAKEIPKQHLLVNDVSGLAMDMRTDAEKNAALGDPNNRVGITRGLRFIYDPALAMPYAGYYEKNTAFRFDLANFDPANPAPDPDRTLPPLPRLPVCPGFVFSGEVR